MMKPLSLALALALLGSAPVWAQGNSHKNAGPKAASSLATGATTGAPNPNQAMGSATLGTGGSAAAGTTSATTLGLGAVSNDPSGRSTALGTGGSAAAVDGKANSRSKITGNNTNAQSKAMANEGGGEWSKSQTKTKIHGDEINSRTKSMSHLPGGPPTKSTTRLNTTIPTP
jgi:hypothetical protein